jgi:threonine dehydratase
MIDREDFTAARERVSRFAHRTQLFTSTSLDAMTGARIRFKAESFQKGGAFKFRGAINAVHSLGEEEASRGVATHSSGNHAQALALAAASRKIPAYIVMPENAPPVKIAAVREYGAQITFCEASLEARESTLAEIVSEHGAVFIHPSDDLRVIAGQGTALLELLEQQPDIEAVLVPVGGGGLASGCALAAALFHPQVAVYGVEPEQADDAYRSLTTGILVRPEHPDTIADGLRTALGPNTFSILGRHLAGIVTVSEESIEKAMRLIWERMKLVVEPSGAVPLAGLLEKKLPQCKGKRIGIILSGGNVTIPGGNR